MSDLTKQNINKLRQDGYIIEWTVGPDYRYICLIYKRNRLLCHGVSQEGTYESFDNAFKLLPLSPHVIEGQEN